MNRDWEPAIRLREISGFILFMYRYNMTMYRFVYGFVGKGMIGAENERSSLSMTVRLFANHLEIVKRRFSIAMYV